jgi:hypothetical protein
MPSDKDIIRKDSQAAGKRAADYEREQRKAGNGLPPKKNNDAPVRRNR